MFDQFSYLISMFWSDNWFYLAIFIISYTYLAFVSKNNKIYKKVLLYYSAAVLVVFILNPFVFNFVNRIPDGGDAVHARFWLVLPAWITISSAIADYSCSLHRKSQKHTVICVVAMMLVMFGTTIVSNGSYIDTSNTYKIRNEAYTIADVILEDSRDSEKRGVFLIMPNSESDGNYLVGGNIYNGIRQYTGKLNMQVLYVTDEDWNNWYLGDVFEPGNLPSEEFLKRSLEIWQENYEYEYVVELSSDKMVPKMEYSGYELLYSGAEYSVYKKKQ